MTTTTASVRVAGVHPYAEKFPMLPEGDLTELAESIRANGLRQPIIVTTAGLILDGRNRAAACELAGVEPAVVVYDGEDLAEYVIDANASRRHMTTGARAMATALVLADDGRRQNGRWKRGSVLGGDVTESRNTWKDALRLAGIVIDFVPDLADEVAKGSLALDAAFRQAEDRRDAERRQLEEEERLAAEEADARDFILEMAPDLAEQVVDGPLETYAEAKAVWEKRNREEAERLRREQAAREAEERAARENAQQEVRSIAAALGNLSTLEHPEARARICDAFAKYSDAAPPADRAMHDPTRLRQLAAWVTTHADEMEG